MTPRRRLVERAPTWRRALDPDTMYEVVRSMMQAPDADQDRIRRAVLYWIVSAGDIHSARLARLVLRVDEYGEPLDELAQ